MATVSIYAVFLRLAWRRSAAPLLDFGREVYTAWRLSAGELLYRDIASLFGPLAYYIDAAALAAFGPSLTVLFALNAVLIAAAAFIIYRFVLRIAPPGTAFLAVATFLAVFAFGHLGRPSYNFLAPYSQAAVWGVVLGMAAVVSSARWLDGEGGRRWPLAAGLCAGLTLLTKPEIAAATLGAVVLSVALRICRTPARDEARRSGIGMLLVGLAVPPAVTAIAFWAAGSGALAFEAVTAAFRPLFAENPVAMDFYQSWTGLQDPMSSLTEMATGLGLVVGTLGTLGLVDGYLLDRSEIGRRRGRLLLLIGAMALLAVTGLIGDLVLQAVPRATPFLLFAGLVWPAPWRSSAERRENEDRGPRAGSRGSGLRLWLTFSLLLFLKLGLDPRFYHYGFYLAAPGGVGLVVVLMELVPSWSERLTGSGGLVRQAATGLVLLVVLVHGLASARPLLAKDVRIAAGADELRGEGPLARTVGRLVEELDARVERGASLVVLPEGASLNYWVRAENPTPYLSFMPPELAFYGQDRMLGALVAGRPDYVVYWDRPLPDYGGGRYSDREETGSALVEYVRRHYRCVRRFPVAGESFAFEVLARSGSERGEATTECTATRSSDTLEGTAGGTTPKPDSTALPPADERDGGGPP